MAFGTNKPTISQHLMRGRLIRYFISHLNPTEIVSYTVECRVHPGFSIPVFTSITETPEEFWESVDAAFDKCEGCKWERNRAIREEWKASRWPEGAEL
jgi:hypothetical protein